jgi:hypothetical protein
MDADSALWSAAPTHGDVKIARRFRKESPQPRGALVAEHGTWPAGEYGRELSGPRGGAGVAEQVHAAMQRVESRRSEAVVDSAARQAASKKLGARDDAALPASELCDRAFAPHCRAANLDVDI